MSKYSTSSQSTRWDGRFSLSAALFAFFTVFTSLFAALPVINSPVIDATIPEAVQFDFFLNATDADGDSLSYSIFLGPAGMTVNDTGYVLWTPNYTQAGNHTTIVRVTEHPSLAFVADTFNITVLDAGAGGSFTDVSAARGLDNTGVTNAVAWGDFNNDTIPDLFLANSGGPGVLLRGGTGGTSFSLAGEFSPSTGGDAASAAWADYDHDGRMDLYVVSSGQFGGSVNRLYHNDTSGVFTDRTTETGTGDNGTGFCASWVDFDADGDPDIHVTNFGSADVLYSNNRNGTFTEMSDTVGLSDAGGGVAAVWGDFNADYLPDLYLVRENAANKLYRNNGDSTFTDIAATAGVGHTGDGAAAAWGDYDNDGDFDLFLANKDSTQVLYSNNGSSTFARMDSISGLNVGGAARSVAWMDVNLDGWQDLLVTFSDSASRMFVNSGDSTFRDEAPAEGIDLHGYYSSASWADPDGGGVPDIYMGRRNGANVYYNSDFTGNWLKVRLHGVVSSRFGVGAVVRVVSGGRRYLRIIDGGSGSQSEPAALFGVDSSSTIDSLTVFWPAGLRRDTTNVAVNQSILWVETDSVFPVVDSTVDYPDTNFIAGPFPISAKITDNNPFTPLLFYSTNQGQTFSTVSMTASGGDFYTANVPGQVSGTRVYYYVRAVDSLGHTTRDPHIAPDTLYDFSVDDSIPTVLSVTAFGDTADSMGPYPVTVRATDDDSLRNVYLVRSVYRLGVLVELDSTAMALTDSDTLGYTFYHEMPGEEIGSQVDYYIRAVDLAGNVRLQPSDPTDSVYSFRVTHFSEGALAAGLISSGWEGVSVADYNGDGLSDVYLANSDSSDALLQATDSVWYNTTAALGAAGAGASRGGIWGDYNEDGYSDLYIASGGSNTLLSNDGDGTFTDISISAGVGDAGDSWAASWVDYNRDGLLDLFVVDNDGSDKLYHNNGDSTFTDTASAAGLAGGSSSVACAWGDYDRDGWDDVYVVYYGTTNKLMRNLQNGTFAEVTSSAGVGGGSNSASATWVDYDNDLLPDLYLVEQAEDMLFRNQGNGTFATVNLSSDGLGSQPGGFGAAWADYDNDSYTDMIKSRGELGKEDLPAVLRGGSGSAFVNNTFEAGLNDPGEHRGLAWLDQDGDGRLDLIVTGRTHAPRLYRNLLYDSGSHYLRLKLVGTTSGHSANGAEVTAFWSGGSAMRRSDGGTGFTSSSEQLIHIGLGSATMVDSVVIRWPVGTRQLLSDVVVDAQGTVVEQDTLYPRITSHDTIPNQFAADQTPVLSCTVADRDSATSVRVHYVITGVDTLVNATMVRDSVLAVDSEIRSWWRFTMPALGDSTINTWSIVIADSRGAIDSTAKFSYSVSIDSTGPSIALLASPDSILPDTVGPYQFVIRGVDNSEVASVSLRASGQSRTGEAFSFSKDTTLTSGLDSVEVTLPMNARSLGSTFSYWAWAVDGAGFTSYSDTTSVAVRPWRGKRTLEPLPVNVTDLMRLIFVIVGLVEQPSLSDSLGLDTDSNGDFDTEDLNDVLALWRGNSTLAGTGNENHVNALASLQDEPGAAVFKLNNDGALPWGLVQLRFDDGKGVPVRIELSSRLAGMLHAEGFANDDGTVMLLFAPGVNGTALAAGSGTLFRVVRADGKDNLPLPPLQILSVSLGGAEAAVDPRAVRAGSVLPRQVVLRQNVPNPFNPSTTISFSLPENQDGQSDNRVRLEIYNLRGSRLALLADGFYPSGIHRVEWNGTDQAGRVLSSGVYFYRLRTSGRVITRKMILLK
jgi:enediyne biosynthesis protein E4